MICQLPQLADFELAKVHLQAIIAKKNKDHLAHYQLANSQLMLVEIKDAAKSIETAINLSPGVPSYHELACQIYSDHRPKGALPEINKAISLDPSRASAFFLRGMLYNSFATQLRSDPKALELLKQELPALKKKAFEIGVVTDKKTPTLDIDRISNWLVTLCLSDLGEAIRLTDKPAHYQLRRGRVL